MDVICRDWLGVMGWVGARRAGWMWALYLFCQPTFQVLSIADVLSPSSMIVLLLCRRALGLDLVRGRVVWPSLNLLLVLVGKTVLFIFKVLHSAMLHNILKISK